MPGILRLWETYSGWGAITEEQFSEWYLRTPFGPCLVVVAEDKDGNIAGQMVFMPAWVRIDGQTYRALRAIAPILRDDIRRQRLTSRDHPATRMIEQGIYLSRSQGFDLIYTFPSVGWLALLRLFPRFGFDPWQMGTYPGIRIDLSKIPMQLLSDASVQVERTDTFTEAFAVLWQGAATEWPIACGVERTPAWLRWKRGNNLTIAVRRPEQQELLGYASIDLQTANLVDLLARSKADLPEVWKAVFQYLHHGHPSRLPIPLTEIKIMPNRYLQPLLKEMNAEPIDYTFAFACFVLNKDIPITSVHPDQWYLMPND